MPYPLAACRPKTVPIVAAIPWYNAGGAPNPIDAWDAANAASYAASIVGLVAATALTEIGGSPGWTAGAGWNAWTGPNRCLMTAIVPNNTYSAIVKFANVTLTGVLLGLFDGSKRFTIDGNNNNTSAYFGFGTKDFNVSTPQASGFMAIAGPTGYIGAATFDLSTGGVWSTTLAIAIGARRIPTGYQVYLVGTISSVAIYGPNVILSSDQVAAIGAAMP